MAQWKFQFTPNEPDIIAKGYTMDDVGVLVGNEINDALRYPFRFHGVSKIVIRLGLPPSSKLDYSGIGGVAIKQYPDFSARNYIAASSGHRREMLVSAAQVVFDWLLDSFPDADFIRVGMKNLSWSVTPDASPESGS